MTLEATYTLENQETAFFSLGPNQQVVYEKEDLLTILTLQNAILRPNRNSPELSVVSQLFCPKQAQYTTTPQLSLLPL